jgi:hypothetical protein
VVDYVTFNSQDKNRSLISETIGSAALTVNGYLNAHTDEDFTSSYLSVHCKDDVYDNKVVVYFVFPRLGVAVPIRHGDVLLFNPKEPHCISSRCNPRKDATIISFYTKSAAVGLNKNVIPLSEDQEKIVQFQQQNRSPT